eukprot:GCRY01003839.1.p1 GENE.GCRY01003839.1~~GCRY01003839.1.p1  ORF type:complete len:778 (-),score=83.50 GCRY01003839.1:94-2403(-)
MSDNKKIPSLGQEKSSRDNPTTSKKDVKDESPFALVREDSYLKPYESVISSRVKDMREYKKRISSQEGGIEKFSLGYKQFGLIRTDNSIVYREWAPGAVELFLFGDFNNWNTKSHKCEKDCFGVWTLVLSDVEPSVPAIPHNSKVKSHLLTQNGEWVDRIPAWITYAIREEGESVYEGVFWNPPPEEQYSFKYVKPEKPKSLIIYEAHIGIASPEEKIASYREFADNVVPRISDLGFTAIQLMAVMEHAYYASFGYQVTNFFAASSRFGTPEDLKYLIDTAHSFGLFVLLDVVHSHSSKNVLDGLNHWDGTDHHYFHGGGKGCHAQWGSRLFNYGHWEVLRFLLSNLRYYLDVFQFDGFRFDGVTSMLYDHHGIGKAFSGSYHEYFGNDVDQEAVCYLMMANEVLHELYPNIITIAEEVSGMPGLCRTVDEGGFGFDYRLAMAVPDKWIQIIKELEDEHWNMGNIVYTLTNRRKNEKCIAYCESHDQALVGDKTIAFRLMDKEMYTNMSCLSPLGPVVDRGMALHKLIRLVTYALGGEGYLTFMGNEFGHPEWLDFPREGNNHSFNHARRRYDLADDPLLRYQQLNLWERAMHRIEHQFHFLNSPQVYVSLAHETDKTIVFERSNELLFIFNFNPVKSFANYKVPTQWAGKYQLVANSDEKMFGGHGRNSTSEPGDKPLYFFSFVGPYCNRDHFVQVYLPSRCCLVLRLLPEPICKVNSIVGSKDSEPSSTQKNQERSNPITSSAQKTKEKKDNPKPASASFQTKKELP